MDSSHEWHFFTWNCFGAAKQFPIGHWFAVIQVLSDVIHHFFLLLMAATLQAVQKGAEDIQYKSELCALLRVHVVKKAEN